MAGRTKRTFLDEGLPPSLLSHKFSKPVWHVYDVPTTFDKCCLAVFKDGAVELLRWEPAIVSVQKWEPPAPLTSITSCCSDEVRDRGDKYVEFVLMGCKGKDAGLKVYHLRIIPRLLSLDAIGSGTIVNCTAPVAEVSVSFHGRSAALLLEDGSVMISKLPSQGEQEATPEKLVQLEVTVNKDVANVVLLYYGADYLFFACYNDVSECIETTVCNVPFRTVESVVKVPDSKAYAGMALSATFPRHSTAVHLRMGTAKKSRTFPREVPTGRSTLLSVLESKQVPLVAPTPSTVADLTSYVSAKPKHINAEAIASKIEKTPPFLSAFISNGDIDHAAAIDECWTRGDVLMTSAELRTLVDRCRSTKSWDLLLKLLDRKFRLSVLINESDCPNLFETMLSSDCENQLISICLHRMHNVRPTTIASCIAYACTLSTSKSKSITTLEGSESDPTKNEDEEYALCDAALHAIGANPMQIALSRLELPHVEWFLLYLYRRMNGLVSTKMKKGRKPPNCLNAKMPTMSQLIGATSAILDGHFVELLTISKESHALLACLAAFVSSYTHFCEALVPVNGYVSTIRNRRDAESRPMDSKDYTPGYLLPPDPIQLGAHKGTYRQLRL